MGMWNLASQFKTVIFSLVLIATTQGVSKTLYYVYKVGTKVVERGEVEKLHNELVRLNCAFESRSILYNALNSRQEKLFSQDFFTTEDFEKSIDASQSGLVNMIRLEKLLLYLKNQTINLSPELKVTIEKSLKVNNCGSITDINIFQHLIEAEVFLNARFSKSHLLVTSDEIEKFKKANPTFKSNISLHLGAIKKNSEVISFILGVFRQIPHELFWGKDS